MSGTSIEPSPGLPCAEHAAQVDHVEDIDAQIAKIVVHGLGQLRGRGRRQPGSIVTAPGPDLGDDDEVVRIRMQRLADQFVGDVRAVVVAGIDVVHA